MNETIDYQFAGIDPLDRVELASFWYRLAAGILDILIFIPIFALSYYNSIVLKSLPVALAILLLSMLYKPLMEWEYGATLGKMIMKIKVVTDQLKNIDLSTSLLRYSIYAVSQIPTLLTTFWLFNNDDYLYAEGAQEIGMIQAQAPYQWLGYITFALILVSILAIFATRKNQTLHDMLAHTFVVRKDSIPSDALVQE